MRDPTVAIGTFSENRINLKSQSLYYYSLYAMNANVSHSTGYATDSFYTLSASPVGQPKFFRACGDSSSILLSWSKAVFPTKGANESGFVVFCSTNAIQLMR